jgi:hypothetical protein
VEYQERGLTYTIKHYVKRIPEISARIKEISKEIGVTLA